MTKPSANDSRFEQARLARLGFADAVTRAFQFLVDLGFAQVEVSETIALYRKNDLEVAIYYEQRSFELDLYIGRATATYSITELIRLTNQKSADEYRSFTATTLEGLERGLARLQQLVIDHAGTVLRGDRLAVDTLEKNRKSRTQDYALDVLASQVRPKAHEAFRQANYEEAAELYERILPRLTPSEQKKLAAARARAKR